MIYLNISVAGVPVVSIPVTSQKAYDLIEPGYRTGDVWVSIETKPRVKV